MRTIAFAVMATSFAALIGILLKTAVATLEIDSGLLNPTLHLTLRPGSRDVLLCGLLWTAVSIYAYGVVSWVGRYLERIQSRLEEAPPESYIQPPEVRSLKNAIRAGDLAAVRKLARKPALDFLDDRFFTPVELAELYGHEAIATALRAASSGRGAPSFRR